MSHQRHPGRGPRGSLRRYLVTRMIGVQWALVLLWIAATWVNQYRQLSDAQDRRLSDRLQMISDLLPELSPAGKSSRSGTLPASPSAVPGSAPTGWRLSDRQGRWLAGDRALPAAPPASGQKPQLQWMDQDGRLMRVASVRATSEILPDAFSLQAAEPWTSRLPTAARVFDGATLAVVAMALAMSALALWIAQRSRRWLHEAARALTHPEESEATPGPGELHDAILAVRDLRASQRRWVDDQRRFLADASHQLRTPMAVLRTQLQSAIAGDVLAGEVLPQMLHTVDRATGLANNLLSLNKLEQLKRQGALPQVDLQQITRDAVVELAPLIAQKRLDFGLDGSSSPVPGDAVMLGELLRNLLANAIHHTPAGMELGVLLREYANRVELVVWDSGPGLDGEVQQRLFQPFSAAKGGVGLGLSICRQIAEAMNAEVQLYNRLQGEQLIGVNAVVIWHRPP